jgi:hypothetical protein
MRGYFFRTPLDASLTTFLLLLFGGLLLAFLIKAPLPTIGFFALIWGSIGPGQRFFPIGSELINREALKRDDPYGVETGS